MTRSSKWTSILFVLWMSLLTAGAAIPWLPNQSLPCTALTVPTAADLRER